MDCPRYITEITGQGRPMAAAAIAASIRPCNDNTEKPRAPRESFVPEDVIKTRRRLKLRDCALMEGAVGRILKVRTPGRLYDVSFGSVDAMVMTLSHCDIARAQGFAN